MKSLFIALLFTFPIAVSANTFDDFGGKKGLERIVNTMFETILKDERIKQFFAETDNEFIKEQLTIQFCAQLDGPCTYEGASMKDSHFGLGIKREHFNALVEALRDSMNTHKVPFSSQNKLLAKLAPMHKDIIE
ncbi:MAG: group 1 truncated hemoglobin [Gammaproteobacteria bacterium]|nr:group 1 truncated hemoglobin [Gammaproteobacteria bacterium]